MATWSTIPACYIGFYDSQIHSNLEIHRGMSPCFVTSIVAVNWKGLAFSTSNYTVELGSLTPPMTYSVFLYVFFSPFSLFFSFPQASVGKSYCPDDDPIITQGIETSSTPCNEEACVMLIIFECHSKFICFTAI